MIFLAGAVGYGLMEIIWRGYTHYSMLLAGGIVLLGAYIINRYNVRSHLLLRAFAVTLLIITVELLFGLVFNMLLGQQVWDYSDKPFNYFGQICFSYSLLWQLLSVGICFLIEKSIKIKKR